MSYVDNTLIAGEKVVARARLHWLIYVWPGLVLAAALSFMLWSRDLTSNFVAFSVFWLAAVATLCGVILLIRALLAGWTTELAVTNFRVISKSGLIERQTVEQILNRVDSIEVTQSLFGRLFDYGTVMITGAGVVHTPLKMIADPLGFRRAVHTAIENHPQQAGYSGPAVAQTK